MSTKYLTLQEYEDIAKKILNSSFPKVARQIINDPDKLTDIINAVATADWKWDGRGTLVGYRKQMVVWYLKGIPWDKENSKPQSLNYNINDYMELLDTIPDKLDFNFTDFDDQLSHLKEKVQKSKILTDREKNCLCLYFSKSEIQKISDKLSLSKEAVKTSIRKGIKKIGKIE